MKTIRTGLSLLFKTILLALLVAVLIPTLYFAWRMGEPLPQPEFKGLSYYQFFEWRKIAHEDAIAKYMDSHPDYEYTGIGTPMTACYSSRLYITSFVGTFQAFSFTLAALAGRMPDKLHTLPTEVTLFNFVPKWWDTFEYLFWYNHIRLDSFGSFVVMCRIQPNIPTPDELEVMKLEHQLSANQ